MPERVDKVDSTPTWFTPGVRGIGAASLLSDLGHEIPTALLPSLLTSTLGAPASALGIIEGVADACAGIARFAGGALADDPSRRRTVAVGGYASTAVLSSLIGVATCVWQVGFLRAGAWASRGIRAPHETHSWQTSWPSKPTDVPTGLSGSWTTWAQSAARWWRWGLWRPSACAPRFWCPSSLGFWRLWQFSMRSGGRRGLLRARDRGSSSVCDLCLTDRPDVFLGAMSAFEIGNVAATFFILRATAVLEPGHGQNRAVELALLLYVLYNATATIVSIPAGLVGDRHGHVVVLTAGVACFFVAFLGFAAASSAGLVLVIAFIAAGVGIGFAETGENAAVAGLAPTQWRGSSFGLLAAIQSIGNLAASAIAGILWTIYSPSVAFLYLAVWMLIALGLLGTLARGTGVAPGQ